MFVPFVFYLENYSNKKCTYHYAGRDVFYMFAEACIRNNWPIISHERYFERFSKADGDLTDAYISAVSQNYCIRKWPSVDQIRALNAYPITQAAEDTLVSEFQSPFDCMVDLLKNNNEKFELIIGELLDKITNDFGKRPEGVTAFTCVPKAVAKAAEKRNIPIILHLVTILRQPLTNKFSAAIFTGDITAERVKARYETFVSQGAAMPALSRKGLLRLFANPEFMPRIHDMDNEPEYDVGVLHNNVQVALHLKEAGYVSDGELSAKAKAKFKKALIRTRPGFEANEDALDNSASCFEFCCKCKRVVGFMTKGMFEAMLAGRIAHEYGSFIFHGFCNDGLEDESRGKAPVEFLNYVLFGLYAPFARLTEPDYLRFLLSNPPETDLYMRSFKHYTRNISQEDLEFYYMSDNRAYRIGDPLYFSGGHKQHEYAAYYAGGGDCLYRKAHARGLSAKAPRLSLT